MMISGGCVDGDAVALTGKRLDVNHVISNRTGRFISAISGAVRSSPNHSSLNKPI